MYGNSAPLALARIHHRAKERDLHQLCCTLLWTGCTRLKTREIKAGISA
jgi:hypothetical protein